MIQSPRASFDSIVAIAGVARSGTSWLGEILDSSPEVAYRFQPLFSYAFKNAVNEDSSATDFLHFFEDIYRSNDGFLLQEDKRASGLYPTFSKTLAPSCLVWKEARHQYLLGNMTRLFPALRVLAIVRHPCAVINSWLRNPKEFPAGSDPKEEWRFGACKNNGLPENFFGFYKWKESAHLYLDLQQQNPKQVRVIRYGDLVDTTESMVEGVFRFLELAVTAQTTQFLAECNAIHKESPYSVYRSKSVRDAWKTQLDPYIAKQIVKDISNTRLEAFLD